MNGCLRYTYLKYFLNILFILHVYQLASYQLAINYFIQISFSYRSLEEHIARGERKGRNFEGFRARPIVVEAKDTNMDIDMLNAYRATIGKHPLPDRNRRLIVPEQLANTDNSSLSTAIELGAHENF